MKLTAADLFTLFQQAAGTVGANGYSGNYAGQGNLTKQHWVEFHKMVSSYIDGAPTQAKAASTMTVRTANEDAISADIQKYEWDSQKIMYRLLYNLGHRINR